MSVEKVTGSSSSDGVSPTSPLYLGFLASFFSSLEATETAIFKGMSDSDMGSPGSQVINSQPNATLTPQQINQVINLMEDKIVTQISMAWASNVNNVDQQSQADYQRLIRMGLDDYATIATQLLQTTFYSDNPTGGITPSAAPTNPISNVANAEFFAQAVTAAGATTTTSNPLAASPTAPSLPLLQPPAIPAVTGAEAKPPESTGMNVQVLALAGILLIQMSILSSMSKGSITSAVSHTLSVPGTELVINLSNQTVQSQLVPMDMSGALAMMAALFGTTIVLTSTLGGLRKDKKGAKESFNRSFAENHIKQTLALVGSPYFEQFVRHVIIGGIEATEGALPEQSQSEIIASMKLVYLLSSLAVYYKAETGKITPEEIQGLLDGTIKLPEKDPRLELLDQIDRARRHLKGGPAIQFWTGALEYFDRDPNMKDLLAPATMLHALAESGGWYPQAATAAA